MNGRTSVEHIRRAHRPADTRHQHKPLKPSVYSCSVVGQKCVCFFCTQISVCLSVCLWLAVRHTHAVCHLSVCLCLTLRGSGALVCLSLSGNSTVDRRCRRPGRQADLRPRKPWSLHLPRTAVGRGGGGGSRLWWGFFLPFCWICFPCLMRDFVEAETPKPLLITPTIGPAISDARPRRPSSRSYTRQHAHQAAHPF